MKKGIKNDTKMSIIVYSGLLTIYALIILMFWSLNYAQFNELNVSIFPSVTFLGIAIVIYEFTKNMKSKILRWILTAIIPFMIVCMNDDLVLMVSTLILYIFLWGIFYKITPTAKDGFAKVVKSIIISLILVAIFAVLLYISSEYLYVYSFFDIYAIVIFLSLAILALYSTKKIKNKLLRIFAIVLIPVIIMMLHYSSLVIVAIFALYLLTLNTIYKIVPKSSKLKVEVIKVVCISFILLLLFVSLLIIYSKISGGNIFAIGSDTVSEQKQFQEYDDNGFINNKFLKEIYKEFTIYFNGIESVAYYDGFVSSLYRLYTVLPFIFLIIFLSYFTKKLFNYAIKKYDPSKEEIHSLLVGSMLILIVIVLLTALIHLTYTLKNKDSAVENIITANSKIEKLLLDDKDRWEEVSLVMDELNENNRSALTLTYNVDLIKLVQSYRIEKEEAADSATKIKDKYTDLFSKLEDKVIENDLLIKNIYFDIITVLFVLFIMTEIYEEFKVVKLLKEKGE